MGTDFSSDKTLSALVHVIAESTNADRLILFGSRASGEARQDSDYDILILKQNLGDERSITRSAYRALLAQGPNAAVDLIVSNTKRFEESEQGILREIRQSGVEVYARG